MRWKSFDFLFCEVVLRTEENVKCWKFYKHKKIGYYKKNLYIILSWVTPFITTHVVNKKAIWLLNLQYVGPLNKNISIFHNACIGFFKNMALKNKSILEQIQQIL